MYLTLFCLLLLWQSTAIFSHPHSVSSLKPRAQAATSYSLSRVKVPVSSSKSSSDVAYPGQLQDNARRQRYLLPVEVEGQFFDLEIDTGSSETWIIQTGFECFYTFDRSSRTFLQAEEAATCNFGATYSPGPGFEPIPDVYELSCYGQTEDTLRCVGGGYGFTSLNFAGFTVNDQVLGAPVLSSYPARGQPEQSGILGLAFSNLTTAYDSTTSEVIPYASVMYKLFSSGDAPANFFALALSRDNSNNGNGGIMTIGGIPDLSDPAVNASSDIYTSAALEYVASYSLDYLTLYAISVDALMVGNQQLNPGLQMVFDSGAPSLQVPTNTGLEMNSYWSPPMEDGVLACDAVLTQPVGIAIGGATYYIPSEDLIGHASDGTCFSWITPSDESTLLVGDAFLKSVVAVFDWDNLVLSFYPRQYYAS